MKTVVEVKDLSKVYGGVEILSDVNLTIESGEIFILLGRNGAGKSTFFKLLTGLVYPTVGKIRVLDEENQDERILSQIGLNINEPTFYEHLNAKENLAIHCQYMKHPVDKIDYWLEFVGLSPNNGIPVKKYSMGMRQRLVLARCLAHEPKLIIIDEPLNGLDPKGIRQFREIIKKIAARGQTIIMSSHILSEVEMIATRIAVLHEGSIVLNERKEKIIEDHESDFEDYLIEKMEGEIICH